MQPLDLSLVLLKRSSPLRLMVSLNVNGWALMNDDRGASVGWVVLGANGSFVAEDSEVR